MNENEIKLGIIHVNLHKGITNTYYDLIFTNQRLIFAKTGGMNTIWFIFWFLFALIGGLIVVLIAIGKRNSMQRRYSNESMENILKLSSANYAIPYSEVRSIKLFDKRKLELVTTNNDRKLLLLMGSKTGTANKHDISEYERIIKNAMIDRIS